MRTHRSTCGPTSSPGIVGLLLVGLLGACGDDARPRIGATCVDSGFVCQGGLVCAADRCLDPAGDEDADGLVNALEVEVLGTDPLAADTDGDGVSDGDEIGNVGAPTDTDGDGRNDAIESALVDEDGDCVPAQYDANPDQHDALSPELIGLLCAGPGVCSGEAARAATVTCPAPENLPVCSYANIDGYEEVERSCDSKDNDCDGETDEQAVCEAIVSIGIAPDTASVVAGRTVELTVFGVQAGGSQTPLTDELVWSSTDTAIATVQAGVVRGQSVGSATIAVRRGAFEATATVSVTAAVADSLEISPATLTLVPNDSAPVTVTATLSDGTKVTPPVGEVDWTILPAASASVDAGVVTALLEDNATLTAEWATVSADLLLMVTPATCDDNVLNGPESALDCGGGCEGCADGAVCNHGADCVSLVCDGTCIAPTCGDKVSNGDETGVDCGGACPGCLDGNPCRTHSDCAGGVCDEDTLRCAAVDECADELLNDCGAHSECADRDGGYDCACVSGYASETEDGRGCLDINECDLGIDTCDDNVSACVNGEGDYACECATGTFEEDGRCIPVSAFMTGASVGGSFSGIDSADDLCRRVAGERDFPHPEEFAAIMSEKTRSAKDRLRIWTPLRFVDGALVAEDAERLWDGNITTAFSDQPYLAYTGTRRFGQTGGDTLCNEWTLPNLRFGGECLGWAEETGVRWLGGGHGCGVQCQSSGVLYCIRAEVCPLGTIVQDGVCKPLPYCDDQPHTCSAGLCTLTEDDSGCLCRRGQTIGSQCRDIGWMHTTLVAPGVDFHSVDEADDLCRQHAQELGHHSPETFAAVLSDSKQSARDRLGVQTPMYSLSGTLTASSIADLWDGIPIFALRGGISVWTGSTVDGLAAPELTCDDWSSTTGLGASGNALPLGAYNKYDWIRKTTPACSNALPLYCMRVDFLCEAGQSATDQGCVTP